MKLTEKQIQLAEEVIWLAQQAVKSNPPQYGTVDLLNDEKAIERAMAPDTVPERVLFRFIDRCRPKQKALLQAVLSLGTGERERKDFRALLVRFENDYEDAADYICGKDSIAKKLANGLKKLGIETANV